MFCSECGKQVKDDVKFCGECGATQLNSDQPVKQAIANTDSTMKDAVITKIVTILWVAVALQVLQVLTDPASKDILLISVAIIIAINYFLIINIQSKKKWATVVIYIITLIFIISFLLKTSSVYNFLIAITYSSASFFLHKSSKNSGTS